MEGLQDAAERRDNDEFMTNPRRLNIAGEKKRVTDALSVLPDDLLKEAVPGNIRKAEHFVAFLKRFVEYLKVKFSRRVKHADIQISADSNACASCCCGNTIVIFATFKRHHIH